MKRYSGFTLIELMMVVAILAIIMAVAIPAYNNQVQKTRRADAQSALLTGAQALERCFTRNNSYANCPLPTYNDGQTTSPDGFYDVVRTNPEAATEYNLRADPLGNQQNDKCGSFTLDHLGNRGVTGTNDRCWGS